MNKISVAVAASGLLFGGIAMAGQFYGGDPNNYSGVVNSASPGGPFGSEAIMYEDFDWSGGSVGSVFSNNIDFGGYQVAGYLWEIRQGVSNGNGGALIASGTEASGDPYTYNASGFLWNGVAVNQMSIDVADFNLAPGTYHLAVAPRNTYTYLVTSDGANSIGTPINNGNNFLNWPGVGYNWYPYSNGQDGFRQFSIGINPAVPAPASAALLGLGGLAATRRRRD